MEVEIENVAFPEYINRGVGVMRDKKLKLEDLKTSHTLGWSGGKGRPKDRDEDKR
jgi:hypothetical protein